jgi:putative transposase
MPWKTIDQGVARRAFVTARWQQDESMSELCRRFGISRSCGYRWWQRAQQEGARCEEHSHRTKAAEKLQKRWRDRVLQLRQRYRFAGAEQLRWYLRRAYPLGPWPSVSTIGRWLRAGGLTRRHRRRPKIGPSVFVAPSVVRLANDAWSVDFKGSFCTGDGTRVCPLTVRDVATRYVLLVRHVAGTDESRVGTILRRLFRAYGQPGALWVDNGPPFGGMGPRGWSKLAASCVRRGIQVEYGRPASPQDNAEHEQMHQVLKAQVAKPAARTLAAQQQRFERWRRRYNEDRPHRALGLQVPCALYRPTPRQPGPPWSYPPTWQQKRPDPRGRVRWAGAARVIGRAFAGQIVALAPVTSKIVNVYFGPHLLGQLHASDPGGIRATPAQHLPRNHNLPNKAGKGGSCAPSLRPSP